MNRTWTVCRQPIPCRRVSTTRQAQAQTLLPWTRPPGGYRLDLERPRQAAGVRVDPGEAALVARLFD